MNLFELWDEMVAKYGEPVAVETEWHYVTY